MDNKAVRITMVGMGLFAAVCGGAAVAPFAWLHWNDTWARWAEVPEERAIYEALPAEPSPGDLADPVVRGMYWTGLRGQSDLLQPAEWAAGDLAAWLTHRHELAAKPERIELLGAVRLEGVGEHDTYYVFSFHGPPGHWAGEEAMVGISGPWGNEGARWPTNPWSELTPGDLTAGADLAMALHAETYGEQPSGWSRP